MDNVQLMQLLKLLPRDEFKASEELANEFKVTSRTIRNRLRELKDILAEHGAKIESKPRYGIRLIIEDENKFHLFLKTAEEKQDQFPNSQEERVQYLLDYLLCERGHYVTIEELSDQLYVSRSTLNNDIKVVKKRLQEYNLSLNTNSKVGIKVNGREFDLRLCIAHNSSNTLLKKMGYLEKGSDHKQVEIISNILNNVFEETNFKVSGIAYHNLVSHLFIAIHRMQDIDAEEIMGITQVQHIVNDYTYEYEIAKKISEKLEANFEVIISRQEIGYITVHLAGKEMIDVNNEETSNLVISEENDQVIKKMLELIFDYFKIDFRDDLELRMSLALHLIPLKVRLYYDLHFQNPLLKEIKTRFTLAYTIAVQACSILKKKFDKEISENEIGYFALHFNLALERKKNKNDLKNIIIVCSSGRGTAELLAYRFEHDFGEYINHIETIELQQLQFVNFEEYDYIITTVPITFSVPLPILEINYFLEDEDVKAVKTMFSEYSKNSLEKYFDDELFFSDVEASNKTEVLKFMIDKITKKKHLSEDFYNEVMKRESQASTEFGNLVAIPHPAKALSDETFVSVAILKKPIIWDKRKVQLVYMMLIENNVNKDLQKFYKVTSRVLIDKEHIRNIIKKKDYCFLMETIKKVEKEIGEV